MRGGVDESVWLWSSKYLWEDSELRFEKCEAKHNSNNPMHIPQPRFSKSIKIWYALQHHLAIILWAQYSDNPHNPLILLHLPHTIKPHHFITNLKENREYPLLLPTEENRKDCTHEHSSECWGCTQASASGTRASIRECKWHFGQWASKAVQAGAYAFNYWCQ